MHRDGYSKAEALEYFEEMNEEFTALVNAGNFIGAEDYLLSEGFELDYIGF
jgi:hypothetical protein